MNSPSVIITNKSPIVEIVDEEVHVTLSSTGPQGPTGPAGASISQGIAGQSISAYRIVYAKPDGKLYIASSDDVDTSYSIQGLSLTAAAEGEVFNIMNFGIAENNSWDWDEAENLYLGLNGLVTATPPTSGFSLKVGFPTDPDKIFVKFSDVIYLA